MESGFLIKNGTIVDGTGRAPYRADLRVRAGVILAIEETLERDGRERIFDAEGCYVTPGFIEAHNHYDGPMWWLPTMEPLPGYGITTSVNGNCGFSPAPVHADPAVRAEMVNVFSFFEDIPKKPFLELLPWDWTTWSEYRSSLERNVKIPVNYVAFVGHLAIRLAVMGFEAWERAATPDEIAKMCGLLQDALDAGAIGLSSNLLDHDASDRPVPTWKADDAEWGALMDVIAHHDGAVIEVIVDYLARFNAGESIERLARIARGRNVRIQLVGGVPTLDYASFVIPAAQAQFEQIKSEGLDFWVGYSHKAITTVINFRSSLIFAQTNNYAWGEIIQADGDEAKFALLANPEWRKRGREGWENTFDQAPSKYPEKIELQESESGAGPIGITLREYMDRAGIDQPSDALADWVLENGTGSVLRLADIPKNEEALLALMRDPQTVGNTSDSGAHGQMFCGVGDNVLLLTEYVRDNPVLKIEEAVHILTGRLASHFNLRDRGILETGRAADVAVFNLEEIEMRADEKRWDVPDGQGGRTYRLSRKAAPMRLTLVNGIATFENGDFTGKFPGRYVGHEKKDYAQAAE